MKIVIELNVRIKKKKEANLLYEEVIIMKIMNPQRYRNGD